MRRRFTSVERKNITLRYFDDTLPVVTMAGLARECGISQTTISNIIKYESADLFLDYTTARGSGISAEEARAKLGIRNETVANAIMSYVKTRFHTIEV